MSSNPLRLQHLLQKYLNNTCSRQELKEFWQLMSELSIEDPVEPELLELWNSHVRNPENTQESLAGPAKEINLEKAYGRLQQKREEQEIDYERIATRRPGWLVRTAVAASILGCLFFAGWLFRTRPVPSAPAPVAAKRPAGHQVINLPDGTIVTLNYDSKLDYPISFNGKTREVYLTGEAFFNVKHDPSKLFLVHTGKLIIRVLGTSFNIRAYSGEEKLSVTVTQGKVQVQRIDNKRSLGILLPGDQLVYDRSDERSTLARADVSGVLDWKKEDLVFDNMTLDEASVLIGNHYGVELRFRNEALRNCRFTGNFSNDSLAHVLDIIGELTLSQWSRDGDKLIWLDGEGCK